MMLDTIRTIVDLVVEANPERSRSDAPTRSLKLVEELGELAEAFLQTTGKNAKQKSWEDVQEEAADVLIVAIDIALSPLHEEFDASRLIDFVQKHLHEINVGFDANVRQISKMNAYFGECYRDDPAAACEFANYGVLDAFAVNALVARKPEGKDMSAHIEAIVRKKLNKWKKSQQS